MKNRVLVTIAALAVAFAGGAAMASAQPEIKAARPATQSLVRVDIGFPFVAGGKELPAGTYTFEVTPGGPVVCRGPKGSSEAMPIITSLGRHDLDKDPELVFDKVDGKLVLSEVWVPGKDGVLLVATTGPHGHAVLGGSNPRK